MAELTEREREVMDALVLGLRNTEIGAKLHISVDTVKTHLRHAFHKLDVKSRTQAVIKWKDKELAEYDAEIQVLKKEIELLRVVLRGVLATACGLDDFVTARERAQAALGDKAT